MKNSCIIHVVLAAAALAWGGLACGCDDGSGGDGGVGGDGAAGGDGGAVGADAAGMDASAADGAVTDDGGGGGGCRPVQCDGRTTECGDCMDNDTDGVVDSRDPECLGPCDNTEGPILLAGVGGETGGPCLADCYFDFGNGPGNDDCHWDHRCDPLSVGPRFDPEGMACEFDAARVGGRDCPDPQSEMCIDYCRPLTPNGCDCFGCCTFDAIAGRPASEGGEYVWIGSVEDGTNDGTCTLEEVTDVDACRPCTPVGDCNNPCGPCELCIGRDTLPPECTPSPDGGVPPDGAIPDGGVEYRCDPGVTPCGLPGEADCPVDFYCVTGCCVPTLI